MRRPANHRTRMRICVQLACIFDTGDTEIIHLDAFGQPTIIISKYEAAMELLDRRAANSSSRMPSALGGL